MSGPACAHAAQQCQRGDDEGNLSDAALLDRCKQAIHQCSVDRSKLANGYDVQTCMNVSQLALCGRRGSGDARTACYDLASIPTTSASPNEVRYWNEKGGQIINGDPYDSIAVSCRTCTDANPDATTVHRIANNGMNLTETMCCDVDSIKSMISAVPAYCDVIVKNATLTCDLDDAVKLCKNEDIARMCNWTTKNDHDVYTECSDQIPKETRGDVWDSEGVPVGLYVGLGTGGVFMGAGLGARYGRAGVNAIGDGLNKLNDGLSAHNARQAAAQQARLTASAQRAQETITLLSGNELPGYGSTVSTKEVPLAQVLGGSDGRDAGMGGDIELQDFNATSEVQDNPVVNWDDDDLPDDYDETGE